MGIIYQFAIRFITVKNVVKVDERCVCEKDDNFEDYLVKAKENRSVKLKEVSFDPDAKQGYRVVDISIPEGTQVITFGNDACDRRGGCCYQINFYYHNETYNYSVDVRSVSERNRFMIIAEVINNSLPEKMDYEIGYDAYNEYTEDCCEVTYVR